MTGMIHCHLPLPEGAKRGPLAGACGATIDPRDRDVRSYQCSTLDEAKAKGVDCPGCLSELEASAADASSSKLARKCK